MEIKTNDKESLTAVQKLPKYDSEVLQYVSRLLRVWVQDEQQKVSQSESASIQVSSSSLDYKTLLSFFSTTIPKRPGNTL